MNKKFWLSCGAIFVLAMVLGVVVHGVVLAPDYALLPGLMRPEADAMGYLPFMIAGHLLMAIGFTWIYLQGRSARPWLGQGIRFGFAFAVASTIPLYLIYYAVCPFPTALIVKQIVLDTPCMVLLGITVAALNRD